MALFDALCCLIVCVFGLARRLLGRVASLLSCFFGFGFGFAFLIGIFGRFGGIFEGGFVFGAFDLFAVFAVAGPVFTGFVLDGADLGVLSVSSMACRRFRGLEREGGRTTLPAAS